eukprot:2996347-Alexandrium_andersonii.AAC.1
MYTSATAFAAALDPDTPPERPPPTTASRGPPRGEGQQATPGPPQSLEGARLIPATMIAIA